MTDSSLSASATIAKAPHVLTVKSGRVGVFVPRLVVGVAIVLSWETIVRLLAPPYVAKPSTVALAIPRVIGDPSFLSAAGATLFAVAEGLAVSLIFGTVLGLAIGRSSLVDRLLRHYVNGFYAVPMVVVVPLFALWFGYSSGARLATVVFASLFSIIVNVADGARAVPREYLEVAGSFRSSRLLMLIEVVLPASMPYFLAGLRLAAGRALIGAVVAEFVTAIGGLGYFILYQSRTFHHDDAFVGVLLLAAFGVGFDVVVNWATHRWMPWYRRDQT